MKNILLSLSILLSIFKLSGQNVDIHEICIIGETHSKTTYCNDKILDSLLTRIKPDLILVELDSSFFTSGFQYDTIKRPYLLDDSKSSNSILATNSYIKNNKKTDIRPFDITGRNDFYARNDFFNKQNEMYKAIFKYASTNSMNERDHQDFVLLSTSLDCINSLKISTLKELNSQAITNLAYLQQNIYLNSALNLVESIDSLKAYKEFAHLQKDFWIKRNSQMVQNIIKLAKNYKRTVVITGNLHKYYLHLGVLMSDEGFIIKEFWEY